MSRYQFIGVLIVGGKGGIQLAAAFADHGIALGAQEAVHHVAVGLQGAARRAAHQDQRGKQIAQAAPDILSHGNSSFYSLTDLNIIRSCAVFDLNRAALHFFFVN